VPSIGPHREQGGMSGARRAARRVVVTVAGSALIAAGAVMLVLPGPGFVTIAIGLSVLGREHAWAAALEHRVRQRIAATARRVVPSRQVADPRVVDLRARPSRTARQLEDEAA
jgi:UPF0716 family protein affecting phage T7 exclusion